MTEQGWRCPNGIRIVFILCVCLILVITAQAMAAKRVALVVGNGAYKTAPLKNPTNDATDMAALLEKLDFEVIKVLDGTKKEMLSSLANFSRKLKKSEVGLFYFAGHGMQVNNRNYLIPTGVNVLDEDDIEFEAVDAGRIISKMRAADNSFNVVILDACRNNPFQRSFRSTSQGLARMDAPKGTIIAYSTGPGSVAADGKGRNGIYTKHLLSSMENSGLDLQNIFNDAGMKVMAETADRQIPWTSNTPIPIFFLAGGNSDELISDAPVNDNMKPTTSTLKTTSVPTGAPISIDTKPARDTPVQHGDMSPGSVKVPVTGWLTVHTSPQNATVRILNIRPMYKPGMELITGQYHIEVSARGYSTEKRWVDLDSGDDATVDFSLKQRQGKLANLSKKVKGFFNKVEHVLQ